MPLASTITVVLGAFLLVAYLGAGVATLLKARWSASWVPGVVRRGGHELEWGPSRRRCPQADLPG
jgi:hypothetical protein